MKKSLDEVKEYLNNIYGINQGGCGIAALAIYRWLRDNNQLVGDESFTFLYVSYDNCFQENSALLQNKSFFSPGRNKLSSCSHVMLFHNGEHHDSCGTTVSFHYVNRHEKLTENLLLESLNFGEWNNQFERDDNVPKISRKLKVDLSDVKSPSYSW